MSVEIKYNGNTIASVEGGKIATIPCKGKKMAGDIVVKGDSDIKYKGATLATLSGGQTATIPCNGKIMQDDITITAIKSSEDLLYEKYYNLSNTSWEIKEDADFSDLGTNQVYAFDFDVDGRVRYGIKYVEAGGTKKVIYFLNSSLDWEYDIVEIENNKNKWILSSGRYITIKDAFSMLDRGQDLLKWLLKNATPLALEEIQGDWMFNNKLVEQPTDRKFSARINIRITDSKVSSNRYSGTTVSSIHIGDYSKFEVAYTCTNPTNGYGSAVGQPETYEVYENGAWVNQSLRKISIKENTETILSNNGLYTTYSVIEYLKENAKKLITFTIGGKTYQAVEGMTWGEWVESEYNTGGYYISGGYVHLSANVKLHGYIGETDVIISGQPYLHESISN